jgi:DNA-binding MarR family transcriptional regulator
MLKKNNADNGFYGREDFKRGGTEITHQVQGISQFEGDWKRTPEWAIHHKPQMAPTISPLSLAKRIERQQQIKERNLGEELSRLGEPVWKILIQLFIATEERKNISVAEISDKISLPETTAIRYINILENIGYIVRPQHQPDPDHDQLRLTDRGLLMMQDTLLELDII